MDTASNNAVTDAVNATATAPATTADTPAASVAASSGAQPSATVLPAAVLNQAQAELGAALAAPAGPSTNDESLELLRKIDTNVTALADRIESVEKTAVRSGAAAGAIAGALSGGIIAAGISIAKAHLGF